MLDLFLFMNLTNIKNRGDIKRRFLKIKILNCPFKTLYYPKFETCTKSFIFHNLKKERGREHSSMRSIKFIHILKHTDKLIQWIYNIYNIPPKKVCAVGSTIKKSTYFLHSYKIQPKEA